MTELTTGIVYHDQYRTIPCCLCGEEWEEEWVGVALFVQNQAVGDLCPRCLSRPPQEGARRLHELCRRLRDLCRRSEENLAQAGPRLPLPADPEALRAEAARVREITAQTRALTALRRAISVEFQVFRQHTQAQLAKLHVDLLRVQAEARSATEPPDVPLEALLSQMDQWPTRLAQVIQAERACFLQQCADEGGYFVRRAVDDRYAQFLAAV